MAMSNASPDSSTPFRSSLRTRFQVTFVLLALAAIGLTVWIASVGASAALRSATYDRLAAIRQTRQHALERYFEEMEQHVVALSTSETTSLALQELREAWPQIAEAPPESLEHRSLANFYEQSFAARVARKVSPAELLATWFPSDPRTRMLQYQAIATNPHPVGSKDMLLELEGAWGRAHAQHHPTFHRYQSAFGFYDIFLISAPEGRVLYTVMKEIDLGAELTREPYGATRLGQVYRRALELPRGNPPQAVALEDFAPYVASSFAPAAFIAAPVRVAGAVVGVLAMQLSIREVDRVMTGNQRWQDEGLGDTGQAYLIGSDETLRSDPRPHLENAERFYADLRASGLGDQVVDLIRHDQTAVLNLPVDLQTLARVGAEGSRAELGVSVTGQRVLRSRAPLEVLGLHWTLVAEIDEEEAFASVRALQTRLLAVGAGLSGLFFVVAGWLGASIVRPMLELARTVRRIGAGDRTVTVPVRSSDEVGQLAMAFNTMTADLERTTVSKTELEQLAGRLISAQEDERRRVARELHDDVVQRVAATAIEVGRLEHLPGTSGPQRAGLQDLRRTLARLSENVHGLSRRIHPAMLDELGLAAGIESECRAFMERGGPPVDVTVRGPAGSFETLPKETALALYRIVQEALRNAWQHADASEVRIELERSGAEVSLRVVDNGIGFDRHGTGWKAGLGLASMEERVRLLGGSIVVESARHRGTTIEVTLPVVMPDPSCQSEGATAR